jgi:hypothetical protein
MNDFLELDASDLSLIFSKSLNNNDLKYLETYIVAHLNSDKFPLIRKEVNKLLQTLENGCSAKTLDVYKGRREGIKKLKSFALFCQK